MNIHEFKAKFDPILQEYLSEKIQQSKNLLQDPRLNSYMDYIQDFVFSGWKRIRPYVMRLSYRGFAGTSDIDAMRFSMVFELLHSMALIHDDVIDQADKRHNITSMHKYIESKLPQWKYRVGESQAILIGDIIFAWVYELAHMTHNFPLDLLEKSRANLHNMIEDVILWQMIDVDLTAQEPASYDLIEKKYHYKTASYTFIRPMLSGAILWWADSQQLELISELWKYLWLAFQLRDDMMDLTFWDPTKTYFTDIQEWQQTYFTHYIFKNGSEEQKKLLKETLWNPLNDSQIAELQKMFSESEAIQKWQELLKDYISQAKSILTKIPFETIAQNGFDLLIQSLEKF